MSIFLTREQADKVYNALPEPYKSQSEVICNSKSNGKTTYVIALKNSKKY